MKNATILTLLVSAMLSLGPSRTSVAAEPLINAIDPMIGTGGVGFEVGSILPGATRPYGMVKLSPDTTTASLDPDFSHCAGYWWYDTAIRGFSHNHLVGTGASDQGNILVMPVIGMNDFRSTEPGYRSNFSHETEEASAGYYAVTLDDPGVRAELTATERVGFHRYTFPATPNAAILIDVSATIANNTSSDVVVQIIPEDQEIVGSMVNHGSLSRRYGGQPIYFSAYFKRAFDRYGVVYEGGIHAGEVAADGEDGIGAYVEYSVEADETLELAVGISYISVEQARLNRETEAGEDWDFEVIRGEAEAAWEEQMALVQVEGGSRAQRRVFYTAFYHAMMMPTLYTDVNGQYMGFDQSAHLADGFTYYTDFSLWDTFRTAHPLYNLFEPARQNDFIRSFLEMYTQSGYIDRWPQGNGPTGSMVGDSAAIVIAESYLKGIQDFDVALAYDALWRYGTQLDAPYQRSDLDDYLTLGYVPEETGGRSTSKTLEYAYDDGAMALFAEALGREEDAAMWAARATSYRNHFNPQTGYLQGRREDGSWVTPFSAYAYMDVYAEGNAVQWSWYAPHDVAGLIDLFGGAAEFERRLDLFFERSAEARDTIFPDRNYWHGNEPDIHAPYLFHFIGRPDKSMRWARWVLETKYSETQDGLDGNDDGGTLSSWYVLSALGLYPIAGTDIYLIGSPLFSQAILNLPGGQLVVEAPGASDTNIYVQNAWLNGEAFNRSWLTHDQLASGGSLILEMGPEPTDWAMGGALPPSLSTR